MTFDWILVWVGCEGEARTGDGAGCASLVDGSAVGGAPVDEGTSDCTSLFFLCFAVS